MLLPTLLATRYVPGSGIVVRSIICYVLTLVSDREQQHRQDVGDQGGEHHGHGLRGHPTMDWWLFGLMYKGES